MSKVMAVNAGSSSLKFQLILMPEEEVVTSGQVERIGYEDSIFTIKYDGKKDEAVLPIKDHAVAVKILLDALVEKKITACIPDKVEACKRALRELITEDDINFVTSHLQEFTHDNRSGIPGTLHRISAIRNRQGKVVGLTCRIGRVVTGTIACIKDICTQGI